MEHEFTLTEINASFLSSHMMELVIMLTGTILLSFVTARLFFKTSSGEKELATVEVPGAEDAGSLPAEHTVYFNEGGIAADKTSEQPFFIEEEKTGGQYLLPETDLRQNYGAADIREEEERLLVKQVKHRDDYLDLQAKDFYAMRQSRVAINRPGESAATLQKENKQPAIELKDYAEENFISPGNTEVPTTTGIDEKENTPVNQYKTFTGQLKELEQKKEKQAYVLLPKKEVAAPEAVVADINKDEENTERVKSEVPVNLLEEKLQLLQKERNDMMGQIFQLENRLKITYLTSLSKVDLEEEEENPIKRLTLYVSMLEGEKQGLNNKIADLSKKLTLAEAGASQIQAKENELAYVKSRLAALEQDKRDVQSQSGEWEVMYKKLYEKTHYLLSAKETELEQLKTNISYLEKDKSRLQERIKDMENELRSTVFNYKGRNPLAFNL
jgi:chaperonin cofactor prefoldin